MMPFTQSNGIAFIESHGFVSEYGIALARLCNRQGQIAKDYTNNYVPKYIGHLGVLTDFDSSGVEIGLKIPGATRLGIDIDTIDEINEANPGLGLKLEDMVKSTKVNSHWKELANFCNYRGAIYDEIVKSAATRNQALREIQASREYLLQRLLQRAFKGSRMGDSDILFIEYLRDNRIELNTILAAGPEAFWNWLQYKVTQVWPHRDYRRAIFMNDYMLTPTMTEFVEWCKETSKPIIADKFAEAMDEISSVRGLIDDIHYKQQEIEDDILNNTLLNNNKIKEIDSSSENNE